MARSVFSVVLRELSTVTFVFLFILFSSPMLFFMDKSEASSLGNAWSQRYDGEKGALYLKTCQANNIDICPVIRVLNKEPSQQFNFIYVDYIAADYVDRLEKLGHDKIEYDVELGDKINSITVNSSKNGILYFTVINVGKKNIQYFEYSAKNPFFSESMGEFKHFLESQQQTTFKVEVSAVEKINN